MYAKGIIHDVKEKKKCIEMLMTTVNVVNIMITTDSISVTLLISNILMFGVIIYVFVIMFTFTGCCGVAVRKIGFIIFMVIFHPLRDVFVRA